MSQLELISHVCCLSISDAVDRPTARPTELTQARDCHGDIPYERTLGLFVLIIEYERVHKGDFNRQKGDATFFPIHACVGMVVCMMNVRMAGGRGRARAGGVIWPLAVGRFGVRKEETRNTC